MRAIGLRSGDQVADIDILEAHGAAAAAGVVTTNGKDHAVSVVSDV